MLLCLIPTVKSGQQGVMVWGCFANHSLGPLVKLEGSVMAISYIDVLENNLLPFLNDLDDQENYFFRRITLLYILQESLKVGRKIME